MKIALLYLSPNGTTRKTTEAIKMGMEKAHHRVESFDLGSVRYRNNVQPVLDRLKDFDTIGFGSPVYHLEMLNPMTLFSIKKAWNQ